MRFIGKLNITGGQRQKISEGTSNLAVLEEGIHKSGNVSFIVTDGVITASGTNNTSNVIAIKVGTAYLIKDKTYYYKRLEKINGTGGYIAKGQKQYWIEDTEKSFVATETEEYDIFVTTGAGQTPEPSMKLLISETSGDTWVQGKKQIPSLPYPSEIEAVGDNINSFDKDTVTKNKYINIGNGTLGSSENSHTSDYIKVYENETYILSYDYDELKAAGKRGYCFFDENKKYLQGTEYTSTNKEISFNPTKNGYIRFSYDVNVYNIKLEKVEKGSKATKYSKFGQGSIEITTSNKNLYDKDTMPLTRGLWISTGGIIAPNNKGWYVIVPIIGGQAIVISRKAKATFYVTTTADFPRNGVTVVDTWKTATNTDRYTLNTSKEARYLFLGLAAADSLTDVEIANAIDELQVELNNELTDYVEHRGETYIMPIQEQLLSGDTFEKIDGVWYEVHNWLEVALNGTENWRLANRVDGYYGVFWCSNPHKLLEDVGYSNYATCVHYIQNVTEANKNTSQFDLAFTQFRFASPTATMTVDKWKEKLAQKNAIIIGKRAEPELIPCTPEQSKILDKIDTYRDSTIITTDNDLCKISLRYKQNLESRIEQIEKQIATQVAEEG